MRQEIIENREISQGQGNPSHSGNLKIIFYAENYRFHRSKLGGAAEHLIDVSENAFVAWALNFRIRMLLKGAAMTAFQTVQFSTFPEKKKQKKNILADLNPQEVRLF